jgi:glycosyltransferase involved in cell wall biosynthesis
MKTVTVIIPAYNAHKFIDNCIRSVISQRVPDGWAKRILVGIDGCDDTLNFMRNNHYQNVDYYYSPKNVGAYKIRNSLIKIAYDCTDAFALFDSDDQMLTGYLEKSIRQIDSGSKFVMTAKYQCDATMNIIRSKFQHGGAMTFTREVIEKIGYFRDYRCAGDTDYMLRAGIYGINVDVISAPLYLRRLHNGALTRRSDTAYGSSYRKSAWAEMTALRESGHIYCDAKFIEMGVI